MVGGSGERALLYVGWPRRTRVWAPPERVKGEGRVP